jgi:hypothetical protein
LTCGGDTEFAVIETHLCRRFQSDTRHPNAFGGLEAVAAGFERASQAGDGSLAAPTMRSSGAFMAR